jgi:rapamycin-insensitive companion of mTOR
MSLPSLPLPKLTGLEGEIMTSIANLSNYVLAASAMNNLKRCVNSLLPEL